MFDSAQVNCDLISSRINFVHELLHKLPNDVTLRIIGNWEIFKKIPKLTGDSG